MFTPKTRLEKILCGVAGAAANARTRLEKAVVIAIGNAGGGGGSSVFETSGEMDMETGTLTVADVTPSELFEAVSSGKIMKSTIEVNGQTVVSVTSLNARVADSDYEFWFMFDNGAMLRTANLSGDEAVVFQFVSD